MQLAIQTGSQVEDAAIAAVQANAAQGGFTIDATPGSIVLAIIRACKGIYLWLQYQAVQVLLASRLATSTGADCDSFVADYGVSRLPGTAASGAVTLSRYSATSAAIVPVGAQIKTTDGSQTFAVLADSTNAAWQGVSATYPNGYFLIPAGTSAISVTVANIAVGAAGNIIAGALGLLTSAISGVDTATNAAPFQNGINAESDAALQARFGLFLSSLARAVPAAIEFAALSVAQNITCAILNSVGYFGGPFQPGYFVVAIDDGSGATPSGTIAAVSAAVAPYAPIGSTSTVIQAPVISAAVVMTITCATDAQKAATVPLVQAAIAAYISALPVSTAAAPAPLPYNRLAKIAFDASPTVTNVTGVTLSGGTADLGGVAGTVVRASSIAIN